MMTMEDKLYAMTGAMLIKKADELGVKVACNKTRTTLKEAKAGVVDRILKAEADTAEVTEEPVEAEAVVEEPVMEEPAVEVKTEEPKIEKKAKTRKVKVTVSDDVVNTFVDDLKSLIEVEGLELKTWDKIKNLYAVKKNGKAIIECYVGKKNYRINTKVDFVPEGVEYAEIKNYYLPACIKGVAFTDTLVFDIIKSLN